MSTKSIIDIEVNSQEFTQFQEYFEKYQDALAKTPKAWREVAQEQKGSEGVSGEMAAAMLAQNRMLHEMESTEEKRAGTLHNTVENWQKLSKFGANFAKSVLSVSGEVLKWGTLLTGGIAAGSIFGIDKMAHGVSSDRQASMGFGMNVGDLRAFRSNFDRLVNPDAFLSWITQMETDPSKAQAFYAMGGGAPTGDTQADATRMLQAIWKKSQTTPESILAPMLQAYGYQGAPEDLMRMRGTSGAEFGGMMGRYGEDRNRFGVGNAAAWQELSTQFARNWSAISGAFETRVGQLAPVIGKLSDGFTRLITTVIDSPAVEKGFEHLTVWLEQAAAALENGDFQKKVQELFSETGDIAKGFRAFADDLKSVMPDIVRILNFLAHPIETPASAVADWALHLNHPDTTTGVANAKNPNVRPLSADEQKSLTAFRQSMLMPQGDGDFAPVKNSDWTKASYQELLGNLEKQNDLPAGFLSRVWMAESSGDLSGNKVSKAGAIGAFQFMPGTANSLGIDAHDDAESAFGAATMYRRLSKKYGGDLRKMLAAYNWGPSNLDADVKRYGDQWDRHLPAETQAYIAKQLPPSGDMATMYRRLSKKYGGDLRKMLAAYNWGPSNLDADVKRYGDQWDRHLPAETQAYIAKQLPRTGIVTLVVRNDTGGSAVVSASQLAAAQ